MSSEHSSQTSSRASRAGRKRSDFTNGALFPMIKALSSSYPPMMVALGVGIDVVQTLSMALNPHVSGHQATWRILYFSQLPFWDSTYATGVEFSPGFVAMYWALTIWMWLSVISAVVGLHHPHMISSRVLKPFLRHVINLFMGPLMVPSFQALLTPMSCTPTPAAMAFQNANVVWLFPEQSCDDVVAKVHRGISIALCIVWVLFALVVASGNFPSNFKTKSLKMRSHPYLDIAAILFKLAMCTSFQLLIPRSMLTYYNLIFALAAFGMAVLYTLVLPYQNAGMNRLMVVVYAVSGWAATVAYVDAKTASVSFTQQGGFYAVLVLGSLVVAAVALQLSKIRYCAHTEYLFRKCTVKGFVPPEENPFAVAAMASDPELLPFPSNLPMSDFVFSPHRMVEMDIIEEAIRNEDELSGEALAAGGAAGSEPENATARMQKYISRVQIVSPTIDTALLPTDAEVSTRFLQNWMMITDAAPTPHMLSFACRIYARFLLKYPHSPTACIAFVRFLTDYAPSLARMNLSVRLLDSMGTEMFCDVYHMYQIYFLTMSVKEVLGVRDKNHERMYRRSRRLHKTTLVQTASVWRSLVDDSDNIVQLCFLANTLSDVRSECTELYLQAMNSASDDEVLFRSFANFVETVSFNKECAALCLEEVDAISRRRRAKLMQRMEQGNGIAAQDTPSQATSRSSMSRLHRQDDDALVALSNIQGSVQDQVQALEKNLNSRTVFYSAVAMTIVLCLVVVGHAGVCLGLFYGWNDQADRTYYGGQVRTLSQESAVQLYRIAKLLPASNTSSRDTALITHEVNKLLAITYAYESAVNFMTYGPGMPKDTEMVKFFKAPQVFLNIYSAVSAFTVEIFTYWTASNNLVQYLTRIADYTLQSHPTFSAFLGNSDVLFVTKNVPPKYSETYNLASEEQHQVDVRLASSTSIAYGVSLAVFALLTLCTIYVFVWNFRRSASTRVQALKLFQVIPKDNVKRLADEAKGRVEKFVSGETMNNEDRSRAMELDNNADLGSLSQGGPEGDGGGFEDDDRRRTSYASKLLAHLFQHGAVEDDDDADAAPSAAAGGASPPPVTNEAVAAPAVQLATFDKNLAIVDDAAVKTTVSSTHGSPVNTEGPVFSAGDAKAAAQSKMDGPRRRHSISLGNAVKAMSESKRHRASILNMIASESEDEEEVRGTGGMPSSQDVVEAELHGLSASTSSTDDDDIDRNSFSHLSGLSTHMVLLILAITTAVVLAVAFSAQILSDETSSKRRIDYVKAEIVCGDKLREDSLHAFFLVQRFVASRDYEDYQRFAGFYKSFLVDRRKCTNALPSMKRIDTSLYIQVLTQFQLNMEIAVALVTQDWDNVESALFDGFTWSSPTKTKPLVDIYKSYVPNIKDVWVPYTNSTHDKLLSTAERWKLAELVLYDDVPRAVFLEYLKMQSLLASAISKTYAIEVTDASNKVQLDAYVALAMWSVVVVLCVLFFFYWGGTPSAKKMALVMALIAVVCAVIAGVVGDRAQSRLELHLRYQQERLNRAVLGEHLAKQFFHAYRAVGVHSDAALYEFLDVSQPIYLSNYQGAIVLAMPFATDNMHSIDSTESFIDHRGDANRMLTVAAKLVLSARGSTLFHAEPRMISVNWNRTAEEDNEYLTLRFPQDDGNMYSDHATDLALNATEKVALAERIISTKRLSYFTIVMLEFIDEVLLDQKHYEEAKAISGDAPLTSMASVFVAISAVNCFAFAIFIGVIAAASIKSFSRTKEESDLYDAIYSGYSAVIGAGLSIVAVAIVAVGVMAIVFTQTVVLEMETLNNAQRRSFYVANAMAYAESMLEVESLNARLVDRLALRDTIESQVTNANKAYFSSSSGFSLRKSQNEVLFGPESFFTVRDTRNSVLSSTLTDQCYNPANTASGNQQTATILYSKFFALMQEIASIDASRYAAGSAAAHKLLLPYLVEAQTQYDTLMHVLKTSDHTYHEEITKDLSMRFNIILGVLIAAVAIIALVMATTVFPIISKVTLHEAGTKLLLTLLPEDILTTCPEIIDFYDANAGTKDDQIKKKLLQSEKLLQNILPPVISRRLKNGESVIADTHPNVTVVFAALIGFDEYSGKMEARQIVHFLNSLIVTFDQITDLLELEKIKTIGDIYFLCGGLTKKTEGDHPLRCMECALLFLEAMQEHNTRHNTPNLTLRIGVNTDPAVAGVIGSKKVAYDLWGDSVNTASRMQSTGLPGKIQVSDKTFHLIKEFYGFSDRKVAAKGKGELTTHLFTNRTKPTPYRNLNWRVATR